LELAVLAPQELLVVTEEILYLVLLRLTVVATELAVVVMVPIFPAVVVVLAVELVHGMGVVAFLVALVIRLSQVHRKEIMVALLLAVAEVDMALVGAVQAKQELMLPKH
jgi:hypothetical protein